MLNPYSQFTTNMAARTQMQLLSPPIVSSDKISLPRQSVIHLLDLNTESGFPSRTDPRLSNIPITKRIPITHVYDLAATNGVMSNPNNDVLSEIRQWVKEHAREFRNIPQGDPMPFDLQTNNVYNYNLLKGRYKYQPNLLSAQNRVDNILYTYWSTIAKSLKSQSDINHFVSFKIPTILPSHTVVGSILKQKESVYARVVTDPNLHALLNVYTYLSAKTRSRSAMRDIKPEQTNFITLELTHNGYSVFFKLSLLLSLSEENTLPSKRKIGADKLQRLFILMLADIQNQVTKLAEGQVVEPTEQLTKPEDGEGETSDGTGGADEKIKLFALKADVSGKDKPELLISDIDPMANSFSEVDKFSTAVTAADIDVRSEGSDRYSDDLFTSAIAKFSEDTAAVDEPVQHTADYSPENVQKLLADKNPQEVYEGYIAKAKTSGVVSSADIRAMRKVAEARQTLKSPYGAGPIDEAKVVTPQDLEVTEEDKSIPVKLDLVPERYQSEVLFATDKKYITKVLPKDVLACVTHLEKANIVIKAYEVETVKFITGSYEVHKLTLKPLAGKESTVVFRLPVINKEGEFTASGTKLRMRKQRTELPIRKISPYRVALTTNYGKLFVTRSEKKAYDTLAYIVDKVKKNYLEQTGTIQKLIVGNNFDNTRLTPNVHASMAMNFDTVQTQEHTFVFSEMLLQQQIDPKIYSLMKASQTAFNETSMFPCGYTAKKEIIFTKPDNSVHIYKTDNNHLELGRMEDLLGIDLSKTPSSFSVVKVLGDAIPLGVVMGYYLGLKGLIEASQTSFEVIEAGARWKDHYDETVLRFQDVKLVLKTDTVQKQLLFAGYLYYKDFIKTQSYEVFNDKGIYLELVEHWGANLIHLKELDTLRTLFVDPISAEVLVSMNEPSEYLKLLLRANELLSDLKHPDANDLNYSRIRSYDRVPGLMYRVLAESVRAFNIKNTSRGKIELDPYKVWNTIVLDTTVKITEDSNPISDVKEVESATFSGTDGLNKSATPAGLRRFHASDKGVISEATVDSSDVGTNFYLTPTPNFLNVRGRIGEKPTSPDANFSTSALLAPMVEYDDPKRIN